MEEAEELSTRSLGIVEAKLGPENVMVAYPLQQLGACLSRAGSSEGAEVVEALSINP